MTNHGNGQGQLRLTEKKLSQYFSILGCIYIEICKELLEILITKSGKSKKKVKSNLV